MAESSADATASRRRNHAWIMLVLALGAAGAALLVMNRRAPPTVLPDQGPALTGGPDFSMEGADVTQYRADGSLEYRLLANGVRHFASDARTELDRPRLSLFEPEQPPWHISARHGVLRRPPTGAPEEQVSLRGNVTLTQTPANHGPVRLVTPSLRVYPRRQYAETDQDVMIEGDVGRTTATGLQGDLQLGILSFSSPDDVRVYTVLEPEQFK